VKSEGETVGGGGTRGCLSPSGLLGTSGQLPSTGGTADPTLGEDCGGSMEYNWLTSHDPITIDANLAEIDFDDFKNEDIQNAYAFSLQSYDDASSSGTDMSICRSEALFSSYKDGAVPGGAESVIQDSLTAEDFAFSEGLPGNKNNYTLTYSGVGTSITTGRTEFAPTHAGSLPNKEEICEKYTTWSNMVRQQREAPSAGIPMPEAGGERGRRRTREENNINNNMDSSRKSRSLPNICKEKPVIRHAWKASNEDEEKFQREILSDEPNLIKLYLQQRGDRNSWNGTSRCDYYDSNETSREDEDAFSKEAEHVKIPQQKNKDAVNNFLKTASKLTSIEENSELSSGGSNSEPTMRPVPRVRGSVSSRSSMSTTPSLSTSAGPTQSHQSTRSSRQGKTSADLPSLDFLENEVGLWDAFFSNTRSGSRHGSVLQPDPLPFENYLHGAVARGEGRPHIQDLSSLRLLLPSAQKHLIAPPEDHLASSLAKLKVERDQTNAAIKQQLSAGGPLLGGGGPLLGVDPRGDQPASQQLQPKVVQVNQPVREAWVPLPEHVQGFRPDWDSYQRQSDKTSQMLKMRQTSGGGGGGGGGVGGLQQSKGDKNLNLINNNRSRDEEREEKQSKRRSFHPQDFLSRVLTSPGEAVGGREQGRLKRSSGFPKSGSQGNLCDSWQDSSTGSGEVTPGGDGRSTRTSGIRNLPAEYPFQANLCLPQHSVNFDLTHKRGLFVSLYAAVERLLLYQDQASPTYSTAAACRCILLHEFCPALHTILEDGLKEEVITSFGRMKTSVWRVIEAVMQAGPTQTNTCDLVMLLNTKFSSEENFKKFSGFVIGLLNMSSLHIWFSKLKWSLDVLLRFYERHAFICALHKETKLLFDELNFCLQRLYSIPFHVDMPFNDSILEEITTAEVYKKREHCANCACNRTGSSSSSCGGAVSTPGSEGSRGTSTESSRTSRSSKSRIPRPISLPKRLEDKLSLRSSPQRASSAGGSTDATKTTIKPSLRPLKSPSKPVIPPRPKSRVRDTVKLFDAKSNKAFRGPVGAQRGGPLGPTRGPTGPQAQRGRRPTKGLTSPKTGGGEGLLDCDSGGDPFR